MPEEDERLVQWREKLRAKNESWVREQANRQLQPNVRKREAAEQELERRERERREESDLAKANQRIAELQTKLLETRTELSNVRSESVWTRWQTIAGWVVAAIMLLALFI